MDLSTAFDTIDHGILLHGLPLYFGIKGKALEWFSSYLTNRTQSVRIHCHTSEPAPTSFGVTQGSVLGPVLFVLCTVSLSTVIQKHSVLHHSYVNDSQLEKSAAPHQIRDLLFSVEKYIARMTSKPG